jgi:SAM-dependent methyltransferase
MPDFSQAPSTGYYRRREIALVKRFFGPLRGKKLLKLDLWNEVHNTKVLFWIAQQGVQVYGLDISNQLVAKAQKNFRKIGLKAKLVTGDMRQINFPDNYFDFLFSIGTIEHIPDSHLVIKEVYRVLKPGGRCLIGVPNKFHLFLRPLLVWLLQLVHLYPYSPERSFTPSELRNLLNDNNLPVYGESGLLFMPGSLRIADLAFYINAPFFCRLTKLLLRPFEILEERFDILKRYGYLIVCAAQKPKLKK